jgi:soluble lytic murein transglycosylase-like protein
MVSYQVKLIKIQKLSKVGLIKIKTKIIKLLKSILELLEGDYMKTNKNKYDDIIEKYSNKYDIPKNIIKAIIKTESDFNTNAIRYETNYRWLVEPFDKFHWHTETERITQKISFGLMQIMGAVAREKGFDGQFLTELLKPEIGIKYGCKHLHDFYKRYNNLEDAISSYNQGSPRKNDEGEYINQSYVDKVLSYAKKFKEGK